VRDKLTKLILVFTIFMVVISATIFVIKYQTEVFLNDLQTNLTEEFQHPVFIEKITFKWVGSDIRINIDNFIVRDKKTDMPMFMFGNMHGILSPMGSILRLNLRFKELTITSLKMKLGIKNYHDIRLLGLLGQPLAGNADVDAAPLLNLIFGQQKLNITDMDIILTGYDQDIPLNYSDISINDVAGTSVFKMLGTVANNQDSQYVVSGSYAGKGNINFDAQFNKVAIEQLKIFFPKKISAISGKIDNATISGSTYKQQLQNLNFMLKLDSMLINDIYSLEKGNIQFIYNRHNASGRLFANDFKLKYIDSPDTSLDIKEVMADFVIKDEEISTSNLQAKINDFHALVKLQANENKHQEFNLTCLADFEGLKLDYIKQWLNINLIPASITTWIKKAIHQGSISHFYAQIDENNQIFQADFNDASLSYSPLWPSIDKLNTTLTYNNGNLLLENSNAIMNDIPVFVSKAYFSPINEGKFARLTIQGNAQTQLQNAIEYLKKTPLKKITLESMAPFKPSGKLFLNLNLDLNFTTAVPIITFSGLLQLFDGSVNLYQLPLELDNIVGTFEFTNNSIRAKDLVFNVLDNKANATIEFDKSISDFIKIDVDTNLSVAGIGKIFKNINLEKISGQAYWDAHLQIPYAQKNAPMTLIVNSSLVGIESCYPYPLSKTAAEELNTTISYQVTNNNLGNVASNLRGYYLAYDLDKKRLEFKHEMIKGNITAENNNKYKLFFDYIDCDKILAKHADNATKGEFNLDALKNIAKPLTIEADLKKVIYNKYTIENISFQLLPRSYGYQIVDLTVNNADLHLQAQGQWQIKDQEFTQLSGNLYAEDFGKLLGHFNENTSISKCNGEINFSLTSPGDVTNIKKNNLEGLVKINFNDGVINGVKPGFGKILGLLSIESIQRRLMLDFSDITAQGLAFDTLLAEYEIHNNIISSSNINIQAPSAQISLSGEVDIDSTKIDLSMLVIPRVGAGIPVAAALATGNPVVGAVIWLVDKASGSQIMDFAQLEYKITGTFATPIIKDAGTK
jgi:hypothetical protein